MEIKTYSAVMPLSAMTVEPTPSKQGMVWLNPSKYKWTTTILWLLLALENKVNNHTVIHTQVKV